MQAGVPAAEGNMRMISAMKKKDEKHAIHDEYIQEKGESAMQCGARAWLATGLRTQAPRERLLLLWKIHRNTNPPQPAVTTEGFRRDFHLISGSIFNVFQRFSLF